MVAVKACGGLDEKVFERFCNRLFYLQGDLNKPATCSEIKATLSRHQAYPANVAFYMSGRPTEFGMVNGNLIDPGLLEQAEG